MPLAHIGQIIHGVHFFLSQGINGRILYHELILPTLHHRLAIEGILLPALQMIGLCEKLFIIANSLPARQLNIFLAFGQHIASVGCAADIMHILHASTASKIISNLHNLLFAHTIYQKVGTTAF